MDIMAIFQKVLNMSIAASWVVLAVLVLRFVLKKAPKWVSVALWALVAVRLICPFSFESVLSLIPSTETLPEAFLYMEGEELHDNAYLVVSEGSAVYESAKVELDIPVDSVTRKEMHGAFLWLGGMAVMALYALSSYLRLKQKVSASIHLSGQIFLCDYIDTPFILGVWNPGIYLPSSMDPDSAAHVLAHERAHLKRKDHWWKPLGFLLLTIHWFNPILWLAYILLCRDIEMACDEKVIREMGAADKKAYSEALLRCSVSRKMIAACPLAFGEVGVKERVKSVLNYKKPAFWIILLAVIALVIAAVCLLTDPVPETRQIEQYFRSLNTSVDIMEDRAKGATTLEIQFVSTSGPEVFLVEVQYKNLAETQWNSMQLGKLQVSESLEHVAIPGEDYIITVTPLEGQPGYATFAITKEGYKQDPQLQFDLPGPNVADMDVQEVLRNIRKYNGLEKNQNPYVNSFMNDVFLRENFDLQHVFIPYFIDQDGKTYLSEAIFNDLAENCTLLGGVEWEEQNTRFLFEHYLNALKYLPQERIQAMLPNTENYRIRFVEEGTPGSYDRVIRYSERGIGATDGWLIHLEVTPAYHENGGFYDTGEKPIHLFYGDEPVDDSFILDAKILEISNKSYLVEPMPGSWELNSTDKIRVQMELDADPMPQVGDILRITYDGQLLETYPAQIGEVSRIQVVTEEYASAVGTESFPYHVDEDGTITELRYPDDFVTYSDHYVHISVPKLDGWEYEVKDWHSDITGNTISCRVKFRPKGEQGWVILEHHDHLEVALSQCDVPEQTISEESWADYDVEISREAGSDAWLYTRYVLFRENGTSIPGTYIAWNMGADEWMQKEDYYEQLMAILKSVRLAEGILREDQAIAIARTVSGETADMNYYVRYNRTEGIYRVYFYTTEGETAWEVWVDNDGNISRINDQFASRIYQYEKEGFGGNFIIKLGGDGVAMYYEGALSSYIGMGTWEQSGEIVTVTVERKPYHFRLEEDALVFIEEDSANFTYIDVADGERFYLQDG